ncbi:probable LRR receptor-like serine/threonine-protein kinase At5g45780 [Prosopis cineraria]|uniref:probable LRR receptor-like serine/threonine-protein kinase At5g45780 n=1 Tax=Prosopis cineraria TaxID=364024 RepID=UPI00240F6CE7|nr:probable LRR receptor-like serine/threonine-protein kinase At5g45780 [Prosopis cineraria]
MVRGKTGLMIRFWCLVLLTLYLVVHPTTSSKDQSKACPPSHCGIITNILYPFRLPDDPPYCGHPSYELTCENNVTLLQLYNGTYQVLGINYSNYTIRLKDPGISEDDCSSLPRYFLSRSNFTDTYVDPSLYDNKDPYGGTLRRPSPIDSEPIFNHVIYLNCSDPVRDDAAYVDTAPCVNWESKEGGGGHVYAVADYDLVVDELNAECCVKLVATIASDWSSELRKGKYQSYAEIHRAFLYGFEISWWPRACFDLDCPSHKPCAYDDYRQKVICTNGVDATCYRVFGFDLFCGKATRLSFGLEAYLAGITAGFPSSEDIHMDADIDHHLAEYYYNDNDDSPKFSPIHLAFVLGKITGRYILPYTILRYIVGILLLLLLTIYTFRRRHLSAYENIEAFIRLYNLIPLRYSYKQLKTMTKGFKTKIGEGGFGIVYKGRLRSGLEVAIKMLGESKATDQEFISEVATIGRIHHFNVVRLAGFCVEGTKRALIYEFMPNGSLDKHIFFKEGCISYHKIYEISLGVARGIAYLHHGCDMQILHFDIKPHNILLDDNLIPKISDFGLAKLYSIDDSIATLTAARGTIGYMAPELFYKNIGKVSYKADVYSFGMLLMEMASRRRNLNPCAEHSSQVYFPLWIYGQFDEKKDIDMEDLIEEEKVLVKKMFIVALWCIQLNPSDRPSMNKAIEMLQADDVESLELPPKPSIYPDDDDRLNFDLQTTSLFPTCSCSNLGEDASDDDLK